MPVDKRIGLALLAIEGVYGMDEFDLDLADGALLRSRDLLRDYVDEENRKDEIINRSKSYKETH